MVRTSNDVTPEQFRELGISYSIIAAIRYYSDAQLLCKNNRLSNAYLLAIRGLEGVGGAILLKQGVNYNELGNHRKKLDALFSAIPKFKYVSSEAWAEYFTDEANVAGYVHVVSINGAHIWLHPMVRFRTEETIRNLHDAIKYFVESIHSNQAILEEYGRMDNTCGRCAGLGSKRAACGKKPAPAWYIISEIPLHKLS